MRKLYDIFLESDQRIRGSSPTASRTIYSDNSHKVDIHAYLVEPDSNYWVATVEVAYKTHGLCVETKYDYGNPRTSDPEKCLDLIQDGIYKFWEVPRHFIEFCKLVAKDKGEM